MITLSKKITLLTLFISGLIFHNAGMIASNEVPAKKGFKDRVKTFFGKKDTAKATNTYDDKGTICPACLEEWGETDQGIEVKKTILKPCNHALCELCATNWLKNNDTCPVCKQKVEVSLMSKIRSKFNSLKTKIEKKTSNAKAMIQDKWARTKDKAKNFFRKNKHHQNDSM